MSMNPDINKLVYKVTHADGSGSCFYLRQFNIFVTNYHVVAGYRTVAVQDNDRNPYEARVVVVNPELDLALLAVDADFSHLPEFPISLENEPAIGSKVQVAGYPFGMPFTLTEGSLSSPRQLMNGKYYIQIDAPVNPGNSGGPILNGDNKIIGVTVSKFASSAADNMGFGIRAEALAQLLEVVESLDRTQFHVQCYSCDELIAGDEEYCPSCGAKLDSRIFATHQLSPLGQFCETAITAMGVNPVLARNGHDSWVFHKGSSEIRLFVYDGRFLFAVSPINLLPKKDVEKVLDYMLDTDFSPYKMGVDGRQIYLCYRIHLADLTNSSYDRILAALVGLAERADELDNKLVEEFGCEFSVYSKA
ncbi:MAG: trypsin-like peptidase domain-containing protein [Bacteroidales bacterium]|nr:trypsin-like peptidase domain-containing protein [Bacteroidales bacterium]MDE7126411.1 trypsin-like peptidase domain-containing protein [Bacteroidales bacterium]